VIAAVFLSEHFGRHCSLILFCTIFLVGARRAELVPPRAIGQIYAGFVVAGFGIGGVSSITPAFASENCPSAIRGCITSLFRDFLVNSSTFANWLDYRVALHIPTSTKQWQIPVGIQLIPSGAMLTGFFFSESPRWLTKQGRHEEGVEVFAVHT
jgi:MFS family permease